jgi:hypothetical protein
MQQFMEAHKDEFPAMPEKGNRIQDQAGEKGDRMANHLDRLEEAGYDVSAIRTAVESGDMETARTLMQQFMEAHKDEFPAPPSGGRPGMGGMKARASQEA